MNKPTDSGWTCAPGIGRYVESWKRTATWDCAAPAEDIEALVAEWRKDWRCAQGGARVQVDVAPQKTTVTISAEIDSGD